MSFNSGKLREHHRKDSVSPGTTGIVVPTQRLRALGTRFLEARGRSDPPNHLLVRLICGASDDVVVLPAFLLSAPPLRARCSASFI